MIIRPNHKCLNNLDLILQEISQTESKLKKLNQELKNFPYIIYKDIKNEQEKIAIAKYLYWNVPKVSSLLLGELFFKTSSREFLNIIKCSWKDIRCSKCKKLILFKSRYQLNEHLDYLKKDYQIPILCENCKKGIDIITSDRWKKESEQREKEINRLKNLPYSEYLQTQHWQELRLKHLKQSKYGCQLCNTKNTILHVHHRTYENLGNENYSDLITLCENCHKLFHNKIDNNQILNTY